MLHVYAVSADKSWLRAVQEADKALSVHPVFCRGDYAKCLEGAERDNMRKDLLLVDAVGQATLSETACLLKSQGWETIIVVAAVPTWKEARTLIMETKPYDFWRKSYEPTAIRRDLRRAIEEMGTTFWRDCE